MKKKLTINKLAVGNLKARKKQYFTMIIGILLAMVFTSSIIFFMFSASETAIAKSHNRIGNQDVMLAVDGWSEGDYNKLIEKKWLSSYAFAHIIGSAYTTNEEVTGNICWLDDNAKELSNQIFLEGRYPEADNEIAVERNQLLNFGLPKAELGDTIKLKINVQNGFDTLNTIEKEYTLVGIVSDKKSNIGWYSYNGDENPNDNIVPSIYVKEKSAFDGGKEIKVAYATFGDELKREAEKRSKKSNGFEWWDEWTVLNDYAKSTAGENSVGMNSARPIQSGYVASLDDIVDGGEVLVLVVIVLIFASCVAIVNSFNSNLKDRKNQIGLMRAVGTTKRQIINIYGREALIISLIVTPLSILISYIVVRILLNVISDEAVMSKSLVALPVAAIFNLIVVLISALIPLKSASRITPMQAIRNINNNRKVLTKRIKSKKQFNTAKLWASRSRAFYKGTHIAVSIILAATVLFSCVAASYISASKDSLRKLPADYYLSDYQASEEFYYINKESKSGFTQNDFQQILSKPYVSDVTGAKCIAVNMVVDDYNDYLYFWDSDTIAHFSEDLYKRLTTKEDYLKAYEDNIEKRILFSKEFSNYPDYKEQIKIPANKEMYGMNLYGTDDMALSDIEDKLVAGKINYNKLSSGEEVILVAPQKAEYRVKMGKNGSWSSRYAYDTEINKKDIGLTTFLTTECPYKVGDTIDLAVAFGEENYIFDPIEGSEYSTVSVEKVINKTVKIGAIISPVVLNDTNTFAFSPTFAFITDTQGINSIFPGKNYYNLRVNCAYELDEEKNLEIMEDLEYFKKGNDGVWVESNYELITRQTQQNRTLIVTMLSVTIIGFAICASIINNSLSSRIRESKKVIGMLRTVGADRGTLVKSFILQMLSMFGWGIGSGYALYVIIYFGINIIFTMYGRETVTLSFNPWIAVLMTALMFAVCSINLYSKIRKEMKNSIIENIREL